MKKYLFLLLIIMSCSSKDTNNLGLINKLPKGTYNIINKGSRHIVYCYRFDGKYYLLNDANFHINNIPAKDAHTYSKLTKIVIK